MVGKLENSSLLGSCDLSVSKTVEQGQNPFHLCCTLPSLPTETTALQGRPKLPAGPSVLRGALRKSLLILVPATAAWYF